MAFVNKQGGDQAESGRAASGQPIDFDPNDPDVVKVHYDVSAWTFDQRGELSEALAESELPHVWQGEELVVPEAIETEVDALFERLEELFGPFPIVLVDDADSVEYGLDEWPEGDRVALTAALVEAEIPHRWDDTTVVVAADAEAAVDDLLDRIESGELAGAAEDAPTAPDGALGAMFVAADKLAKDPMDAGARRGMIDLLPQIDPKHPPYGLAVRTWAGGVDGVRTLVELIDAQAVGTDPNVDHESAVIGAAQELRALLRPYV
ncbi:MAG TPA: hypothetical protein VK860_02190 [Ilumatobacteraceae bacterium]|nr:hypothetical protein [Ilumatobacteraceae bacterium]